MIKERNGDYCLRVCDVCGNEQWIGYWNAYKKDRHLCRYCNNHEQGKKRIGKFVPHNKGNIQYPKNIGNFYINPNGYVEMWVGKHTCSDVAGGYYKEHRLVVEADMGRKLTKEEIVHHINGDKIDNRIDNLHVCSNDKEHRNIHSRLERLAMKLVKAGVISFDKELEDYYIVPSNGDIGSKLLELLENPTQSGEDNQQRSLRELEPEERSKTIQKWSTLQAIGSGSGEHPTKQDDDIVCSAQ